jgi:hypothetical protein
LGWAGPGLVKPGPITSIDLGNYNENEIEDVDENDDSVMEIANKSVH